MVGEEDAQESKEKFCHIGNGWLATTHVDSHGHQLTIKALKKMIKSLEENSLTRVLNFEHDSNNIIGEILKWKIMEKEKGYFGIYIEYGILNGREDIVKQIEEGILKGFSYSAMELEEGDKEEDFYKMDVKIDLDGKDVLQVEKILKFQKIKFITKVNKSADVFSQIAFYAGTLAAFLNILKILYYFYKEGKKKGGTFVFNNCTFNFQTQSFEEISEEIKKEWKD